MIFHKTARRRRVRAAGLASWVWLAACSPGLNWRDTQPEGGGWGGLFPCRPSQQTRRLPLGDAAIEWRLSACEAGDTTFAVGTADVGDPARVGPLLQSLKLAAGTSVHAAAAEPQPFSLPGLTPQTGTGRWQLTGQRLDGARVQVEMALFARGTRVFQAMLIGPALPSSTTQIFFEALRVTP